MKRSLIAQTSLPRALSLGQMKKEAAQKALRVTRGTVIIKIVTGVLNT